MSQFSKKSLKFQNKSVAKARNKFFKIINTFILNHVNFKKETMNTFWDDKLPPDYYDTVLTTGLVKKRGIQSNWHNTTFLNVKKRITSSKNHLDYACGPGSFIGIYLDKDCIGVDISQNQIEFAKNKYGTKGSFYINSDFDHKKYENYFDSISTIGLLEYLDDDETISYLNKMQLILKPGGKLIITTPNYSFAMKTIEKVMHFLSPMNYSSEHKNKHTKKSLSNLLEKSSFQNYEIEKFMNFGIAFSFLSLNFGYTMNNLFSKFTKNRTGLLFIISLKK